MRLRKVQTKIKHDNEYKKNETANVEYTSTLHQSTDNEKEVQLQQLEYAVTLLKDEQQTCIDLFYLKKKSYVEVADETGFTMKQVKSYIQNGKRNLKILIEKLNEQEQPI